MINKSDIDTCVIGSGAHTAPAHLIIFCDKDLKHTNHFTTSLAIRMFSV